VRRTGKWLWPILGSAALGCLVLLLVGFGWALKDHWWPSGGLTIAETPSPPQASAGSLADKPEWKIAALGDSLTVGTGDSTGQGYVRRAAEAMDRQYGKSVRIVGNLAVGGMRADQLLAQLGNTGYIHAISQADIVMLTIGGNDLFQMASAGGSMVQGGDISPEELALELPIGQERLREVLAEIRKLNGNARIVYVGLYNPFYDLPSLRETASEVVRKWNDFAHALAVADGNMTVVPTYDLFEFSIASHLSADHFHPNDTGYARIAERIVQAVQ